MEELQNIDVTKIALVDLPAIRKKFLFKKSDMQNAFEQNQDVSDIRKELNTMNKELLDALKEYFGEEVSFPDEEFEKAKLSDKALNAIKGAVNLVNKYKADFPDDLKKAVGVLAKYASYGYGYPAAKKEEDVSKAGKVLSKDNVTKIKNLIKAFDSLKDVVKALNDLLPAEDQSKIKKSDTSEGIDADGEFKKALDSITDITKKLEKKLDEKDDTIEKLNKRLETVEKEKGIKKSIDGQDDNDDDKTKGKKWGSFNLE